jgi:crotonobetainyl-CoA:carnitine CoA-transferase CaiB-like acyl-CoA transferase
MRMREIRDAERQHCGKPLDGVRILAAEQMQALPDATQPLAPLGADVVTVEHPLHEVGNPIEMSRVAEGPVRPWPRLGQHTDEVLHETLGLEAVELESLRCDGVIA